METLGALLVVLFEAVLVETLRVIAGAGIPMNVHFHDAPFKERSNPLRALKVCFTDQVRVLVYLSIL